MGDMEKGVLDYYEKSAKNICLKKQNKTHAMDIHFISLG